MVQTRPAGWLGAVYFFKIDVYDLPKFLSSATGEAFPFIHSWRQNLNESVLYGSV